MKIKRTERAIKEFWICIIVLIAIFAIPIAGWYSAQKDARLHAAVVSKAEAVGVQNCQRAAALLKACIHTEGQVGKSHSTGLHHIPSTLWKWNLKGNY